MTRARFFLFPALLATAALAAVAVTACAVNDRGLNLGADAAPGDATAPVDRAPGVDAPTPVDVSTSPDVARDLPAEQPGVVVDAGPDLSCGACDGPATFVTLPGGRFQGTTAGPSANQGSCGGADAPEAVFKIELLTTSDLFVSTHGTGFDTVLYLRRDCCGIELDCNDDADGRGTSVLSEHGLDAGTYYITVDGASAGDGGDFTVDIYASTASGRPGDSCGNPTPIGADAVTGNTCGYRDDYSPLAGCSSAVSGTSGLDQVYYFVLDQPSTVTFSTCDNTCIDTVLYLRDVCTDASSQRACDDDSCRASGACQPVGNQVQSRVTATLAAGAHYLVLDTFSASQGPCGDFTITPTGVP